MRKLPSEFELDVSELMREDVLTPFRERYVKQFGSDGLARVGGRLICTLEDLAFVEQLRTKLRFNGDLGVSVATDVFTFVFGEPSRRDVTKVGGLPYRPAREPWPQSPDRTPLTFVAQFRFAESKDLFEDVKLPGDVLLIFAVSDDLSPDKQELVTFEWYPLGLTKLVDATDVPAPSWEFITCYGRRYRTVDYPNEQALKVARTSLHEDAEIWQVVRLEATKIGGAPMWIQPVDLPDDLPGRFLCSLATIDLWDDAIPDAEARSKLSWNDSGSLYFSLDKRSKMHWNIQGY